MSKLLEFMVIVTFPEAPAGIAQSEHRLKASNVGTAVGRAISQAHQQLKRKTKHRKLWVTGKCSWQIVAPAAPTEYLDYVAAETKAVREKVITT